ncbi:MAG: VanZ family protein [Nitrococcus sp.]|nr:VanZ family protein [Nitrococcus sp.]
MERYSTLSKPRSRLTRLMAGAYLLLLAYGTLFPLRNWRPPGIPVSDILLRLPTYAPSADMATNVLIYIPASILLVFALPGARLQRAVLAVTICAALSFSLEYLQAWLPARTPSSLDLMLNTTGALLGTLAAPLVSTAFRYPTILPAYENPLRDEPATWAGVTALALWIGSHWAPFVPSLDPWQVWQSVKPVWITIRDGGFDPVVAGAYTLETLAIGVVLTGVLRNPYLAPVSLAGLMAMLLVGKPLIVMRSLSAESLAGVAIGTLLFALAPGPFTRRRAAFGAGALLAAWAMATLAGAFSATPQEAFNWIPLREHLTNPISGILDLIDTAWPAAVLAYLALRSGAHRRGTLACGALAVLAYAGALEWLQRWQPESYPDVTDILVPGFAWVITFLIGMRSHRAAARPGQTL